MNKFVDQFSYFSSQRLEELKDSGIKIIYSQEDNSYIIEPSGISIERAKVNAVKEGFVLDGKKIVAYIAPVISDTKLPIEGTVYTNINTTQNIWPNLNRPSSILNIGDPSKLMNNDKPSIEAKEELGATRKDGDKNQLGLISPFAIEHMGKVLTFGAKKYDRHNWRKGMDWSRCIDSLKRHMLEFEKSKDRDDETGELHMAHIMVNAMFLLEYHFTHPELDDRYKFELKNER